MWSNPQVTYPRPGVLGAEVGLGTTCSNFPSALPISPTPSFACLLPSAMTLFQEAQHCLPVPKRYQ